MRALAALIGTFVFSASALAEPNVEMLKFAITRNGDQIGTQTTEVRRTGTETVVSMATRLVVKVMFITAYRFEQTETERWVNGRFVSMTASTDDNGTLHKVKAEARSGAVTVDADGKVAQMDANAIPASLWNASLVKRTTAFNPQDGSLMKLTVIDNGTQNLTVQGRPVKAHHYTMQSTFTQDLWYDEQGHLVKVELIVKDGSTIAYQPLPPDRVGSAPN